MPEIESYSFCLTVPCLCSIWYGLHLWSITCRFMRVSLLSDWQSDWQMNRQSDWVTTRLYNWLIRPAERPSAMLAHWLTGSLTDYLNDSLGDERRPAVWLTNANLTHEQTGWVSNWLADWHINCLSRSGITLWPKDLHLIWLGWSRLTRWTNPCSLGQSVWVSAGWKSQRAEGAGRGKLLYRLLCSISNE